MRIRREIVYSDWRASQTVDDCMIVWHRGESTCGGGRMRGSEEGVQEIWRGKSLCLVIVAYTGQWISL